MTAPDRAVLARAEADWRATPPDLAGWVSLSRDASQALMAEYDRRGAELERQREENDAARRLLADERAANESYRDRLLRIGEAHSKSVDSAGGTWGDCSECGWSWPCPTHVWATQARDVLAPWNPSDDEETDDD